MSALSSRAIDVRRHDHLPMPRLRWATSNRKVADLSTPLQSRDSMPEVWRNYSLVAEAIRGDVRAQGVYMPEYHAELMCLQYIPPGGQLRNIAVLALDRDKNILLSRFNGRLGRFRRLRVRHFLAAG